MHYNYFCLKLFDTKLMICHMFVLPHSFPITIALYKYKVTEDQIKTNVQAI